MLKSTLATALVALCSLAATAPLGPKGPCAEWKVDAILKGDMAPEECCSYGVCKGGVVVAVGV